MKNLQIKGDVVSDEVASFYEYFGMSYVSPAAVANILNNEDDDPSVIVEIASNGGDVFAASEIYTMLRSYEGKVTVNIQGLAASAASVIAMAGDIVNISPTALIMIHNSSTIISGNKDDLVHEISVLESIDKSIALAYELKTGLTEAELLNLMTQETWLTAKDAVDKGFADEIMFVDDNVQIVENSISHLPSKAAVNKFFNSLMKTETNQKNKKEHQSKRKSSLKDKKLAILLDKKRKEE